MGAAGHNRVAMWRRLMVASLMLIVAPAERVPEAVHRLPAARVESHRRRVRRIPGVHQRSATRSATRSTTTSATRRRPRRDDVAAKPDALLAGAVAEALEALESPVTPVPDAFVQRIHRQLRHMQLAGGIGVMWRRRAKLWPQIAPALEKQGLPPLLANLGWPESNFIAQTCSRLGARGIWQLVPSAAEHLGLEVAPECAAARPARGTLRCPCAGKDERLDPARATESAARLLAQFTTAFGRRDILLGIASYNIGPNRIHRILKQNGIEGDRRNFWEMYRRGLLPDVAVRLVADVVGITVVSLHPDRYGLPPLELAREYVPAQTMNLHLKDAGHDGGESDDSDAGPTSGTTAAEAPQETAPAAP